MRRRVKCESAQTENIPSTKYFVSYSIIQYHGSTLPPPRLFACRIIPAKHYRYRILLLYLEAASLLGPPRHKESVFWFFSSSAILSFTTSTHHPFIRDVMTRVIFFFFQLNMHTHTYRDTHTPSDRRPPPTLTMSIIILFAFFQSRVVTSSRASYNPPPSFLSLLPKN